MKSSVTQLRFEPTQPTSDRFLPVLPCDVLNKILLDAAQTKSSPGPGGEKCKICGRIRHNLWRFLKLVHSLLRVSNSWRETIIHFLPTVQSLFFLDRWPAFKFFSDVEEQLLRKVTCLRFGDQHSAIWGMSGNYDDLSNWLMGVTSSLDLVSCIAISRAVFDERLFNFTIDLNHLKHVRVEDPQTELGLVFSRHSLETFQLALTNCQASNWCTFFNLTGSTQSLKCFQLIGKWNDGWTGLFPDLSEFSALENVRLDVDIFPSCVADVLQCLYTIHTFRITSTTLHQHYLNRILKMKNLKRLIVDVTGSRSSHSRVFATLQGLDNVNSLRVFSRGNKDRCLNVILEMKNLKQLHVEIIKDCD